MIFNPSDSVLLVCPCINQVDKFNHLCVCVCVCVCVFTFDFYLFVYLHVCLYLFFCVMGHCCLIQ